MPSIFPFHRFLFQGPMTSNSLAPVSYFTFLPGGSEGFKNFSKCLIVVLRYDSELTIWVCFHGHLPVPFHYVFFYFWKFFFYWMIVLNISSTPILYFSSSWAPVRVCWIFFLTVCYFNHLFSDFFLPFLTFHIRFLGCFTALLWCTLLHFHSGLFFFMYLFPHCFGLVMTYCLVSLLMTFMCFFF